MLHFVVEQIEESQVGSQIVLTGAEAHHAAVVRRVRQAEMVTIGNGKGLWLTASVVLAEPDRVELEVVQYRVEQKPDPKITLVQALAKGDRDEMAIQAACELGVDEVIPWQAERSVSRWEGKKAEKNRQRWSTIVREAAKQAHRAWIPSVLPVKSTAELISWVSQSKQQVILLEPTASSSLAHCALDATDLVVVVGPEGGFSQREISALVDAGAQCASLGPYVLRTSTAGPAALAVLATRVGRW